MRFGRPGRRRRNLIDEEGKSAFGFLRIRYEGRCAVGGVLGRVLYLYNASLLTSLLLFPRQSSPLSLHPPGPQRLCSTTA